MLVGFVIPVSDLVVGGGSSDEGDLVAALGLTDAFYFVGYTMFAALAYRVTTITGQLGRSSRRSTRWVPISSRSLAAST